MIEISKKPSTNQNKTENYKMLTLKMVGERVEKNVHVQNTLRFWGIYTENRGNQLKMVIKW